MRCALLLCGLLLLPAAVLVAAGEAETEPAKIKPEEAADHVGEKVVVTMEVRTAKNAARHKKVFLDSRDDFRDEENLGIAISEKGAEDLKASQKIADPAAHYRGKTIRVTGKVVERDGRLYVDVDEAKKIELVEDPETKS